MFISTVCIYIYTYTYYIIYIYIYPFPFHPQPSQAQRAGYHWLIWHGSSGVGPVRPTLATCFVLSQPFRIVKSRGPWGLGQETWPTANTSASQLLPETTKTPFVASPRVHNSAHRKRFAFCKDPKVQTGELSCVVWNAFRFSFTQRTLSQRIRAARYLRLGTDESEIRRSGRRILRSSSFVFQLFST